MQPGHSERGPRALADSIFRHSGPTQAKRAAHKEKHDRGVEAQKAAAKERNRASALRKLRADKNFIESTTHTGSAGKLDKGARGTGAFAKDREAERALVHAHAEAAAAKGRLSKKV